MVSIVPPISSSEITDFFVDLAQSDLIRVMHDAAAIAWKSKSI